MKVHGRVKAMMKEMDMNTNGTYFQTDRQPGRSVARNPKLNDDDEIIVKKNNSQTIIAPIITAKVINDLLLII